jgi:hypothetical protein
MLGPPNKTGTQSGRDARGQSYDFGIYNFNASAVVDHSVFQSKRKDFFYFKTHLATRGAVNFYNAGFVTPNRRIGPRIDIAKVFWYTFLYRDNFF